MSGKKVVKMKETIWIMILILLSISCYATTTCYYNNSCGITAEIRNGSVSYGVDHANISIYYANGTILQNQTTMTNLATGVYVFNFTPQFVETYSTTAYFFNSSGDLVGSGSDDVVVTDSANMAVQSSNAAYSFIGLIIAAIGIGAYFIMK